MGAHARLGPSNHRWPNCPGSVSAESQYVDVAGAAAIDGTGSHELLELCLNNGVRAETYIGQAIAVGHHDSPNGWMVHADRADRVQMCIDYVARRYAEIQAMFPASTVTIIAEGKAYPGQHIGRDDWWGTVDVTITAMGSSPVPLYIEICDYKDGRGWVNANDNSQLLSYLIGRVPDMSMAKAIHGCRVSIVQPKTNPVVRYDDIKPASLPAKLAEFKAAAEATDSEDAPLVAGKHCQWCKANPKRGGHCKADATKSIEVMSEIIATDQGGMTDLIKQLTSDVTAMDEVTIAKLMDAKDGLLAAFGAVEDEIKSRVERGVSVPGYAMRPGRTSKVYAVSDEQVEKVLKGMRLKKDVISPPKLMTPAQLVKCKDLKPSQLKRVMDELIVDKAGADKLTKVAKGDENTGETMFKDVEEVAPAKSAESLFADVTPEPADAVAPTVSFM